MTEYPTRRALREAERLGSVGTAPNPSAISDSEPRPQHAAPEPPESSGQDSFSATVGLTRRQLRERGLTAAEETTLAEPAKTEQPIRPGSRRSLRSSPAIPVEPPQIDVPDPEFTGQNLLAEPSTASIVLERAPEAIELPIDTGELTVTGSIQVITGPISSPSTATVDSVAMDEELDEDAVTGVLSTVEPISALELIGERSSTGVVPSSALKRGWWKPLALAVVALLLAVATIWATITILGAVGG